MAIFKHLQRKIRQRRIRKKIKGTKERPRLSVFRSNRYIYTQLIDDNKGITLVAADDREVIKANKSKLTKRDAAFQTGRLLAKKALKKGIKRVIFDRGGYKYHGRVKSVADGAREGGLEF